MLFVRMIFIAIPMFLFFGCAPSQEVTKRYFWPLLSDDPKIEYISSYQSDYDIEKETVSAIELAIFGREAPVSVFSHPYDVLSNGGGKFYVSEPVGGFVHAIDLVTGQLEKLRDRKGNIKSFVQPMGLAGDSIGQLYVVDAKKKKICIYNSEEKLLDEWFLDGINRPVNLAVDESRSRIYVVSPDDHQVFVYSAKTRENVYKIGRRGTAQGEFNFPVDLDLDMNGNLFVLDALNARVQVFDADGKFLRSFGERGTALGSFQMPKGIAVSPSGHVYVTDSLAHRIVVFSHDGIFLTTIGGKYPAEEGGIAPGGFYLPEGVDVDKQETIWIVDTLNRMIHRFQYLTEDYLKENPVLPGQAVIPQMFKPQQ
ncbi:MAG: hypothetical protein C0623_11855 [Desulfuromonas sp.]|nr:MAG: hypothetical protein C0623_11855 [Desulfuromonas sp.]